MKAISPYQLAGSALRTERLLIQGCIDGERRNVRSERENFSENSAAGALTGGIAVLRTAGEGTGGTLVRSADPTTNLPCTQGRGLG
jgi:hypothetical protein